MTAEKEQTQTEAGWEPDARTPFCSAEVLLPHPARRTTGVRRACSPRGQPLCPHSLLCAWLTPTPQHGGGLVQGVGWWTRPRVIGTGLGRGRIQPCAEESLLCNNVLSWFRSAFESLTKAASVTAAEVPSTVNRSTCVSY